MARGSSTGKIGEALTFVGALIYLFVYYSWYSAGYGMGAWLSAAQFLAPFVIGVALFSAVSLFFMGLGGLSGQKPPDEKMARDLMWKFIMWGAIGFVIITGGTSWYWWAILAFLLTFLGGMAKSM